MSQAVNEIRSMISNSIRTRTPKNSFYLYLLDQAEAECKRNDELVAEAKAKNLKTIPHIMNYARINLEDCQNPLAAGRVWPLADVICKYAYDSEANALRTIIENMRECDVEPVREFLKDVISGCLIENILDNQTM